MDVLSQTALRKLLADALDESVSNALAEAAILLALRIARANAFDVSALGRLLIDTAVEAPKLINVAPTPTPKPTPTPTSPRGTFATRTAAVAERDVRPPNTATMPFGAHKGVPLAELADERPNYLQWLLGQTWLDNGWLRAAATRALTDAGHDLE